MPGEMSAPNCCSVVRKRFNLLSWRAPHAGGSCCCWDRFVTCPLEGGECAITWLPGGDSELLTVYTHHKHMHLANCFFLKWNLCSIPVDFCTVFSRKKFYPFTRNRMHQLNLDTCFIVLVYYCLVIEGLCWCTICALCVLLSCISTCMF